MQTAFRWLLGLTVLCCTVFFFLFSYQIRLLKKQTKAYARFAANIESGFFETSPLLGNLSIPVEMQNIPLAEKKGLVLSSKTIEIRNVVAPYNPSIIKNEKGYLLFFRYDVIKQSAPDGFLTYVGSAQLDSNFNQTSEEYKTINTGSPYSEDPRIVQVGADLYLFFNDLHPCGALCGRTMRVGKVNLEESKLDFVSNLDLNFQRVEKNWVPFEFIDAEGKANLYIEYFMNPHKILKLISPQLDSIIHLTFPNIGAFQRLFWPKIWGEPRGGSTAQKVGDQYLSFFHSAFEDKNGYFWYLFGAYTFEPKPHFRITAISHYPILFEGIYDSPLLNTAPPNKRVIFPAGFTTEEKEGKRLIHVACGENDCAVKIVTFDEETLLKSLKKL